MKKTIRNIFANMMHVGLIASLAFMFNQTVLGKSVNTIVHEYVDFTRIDEKAMNIPKEKTNSVRDLANHIKTFAKTDLEFVRALYVWFGSPTGLEYDFDYIQGKKKRPSQQSQHALSTKIGVCVAYANIMVDACRQVGISAWNVSGKTSPLDKDIEKSTYQHAWVLVKVNGKYGLIDPTWGATIGYMNNENEDIKGYKILNNAYFFYHPYEFGERRKSDIPEFDLRVIPNFTINRNTLPNTFEGTLKQHPVFRKYIDNLIAKSKVYYEHNTKVDKEADSLFDIPEEHAAYVLSKMKRLKDEYFLARDEYISMNFTGYLTHFFKEKTNKPGKSKKVFMIDHSKLNSYPFLQKQLLFLVESPDLDEFIANNEG